MYRTLRSRYPVDRDLPPRAFELSMLNRVLDGSIYDVLKHDFHNEQQPGGARDYIPLRDRAPCVRYNLCSTVVRDSVALLFGEGRFPTIECNHLGMREAIESLVTETNMPRALQCAAQMGSVGSVVVLMRVLKGKLFWDVLPTTFLTPTFDPDDPNKLVKLTECYKASGQQLLDLGYDLKKLGGDDTYGQMVTSYWFQRIWSDNEEIWHLPAPVGKAKPSELKRDKQRSIAHNLGFCPAVWVHNLPGKGVTGSRFDGACTFAGAIDTQIEIEYQLSQAGRALKYSADPTLVIKEPAAPEEEIVRSAGAAILVSDAGDAKLLEIGGTASTAVLEFCRTLREFALETIRGNRSSADKLNAAVSGRAIELMYQGPIWLADDLRLSYGHGCFIPLVRMAMEAAAQMPVFIGETRFAPVMGEKLTLRWPQWFEKSPQERLTEAQGIRELRDTGSISRRTGTKFVAKEYHIDNIDQEETDIAKDKAEQTATLIETTAQVKATERLES